MEELEALLLSNTIIFSLNSQVWLKSVAVMKMRRDAELKEVEKVSQREEKPFAETGRGPQAVAGDGCKRPGGGAGAGGGWRRCGDSVGIPVLRFKAYKAFTDGRISPEAVAIGKVNKDLTAMAMEPSRTNHIFPSHGKACSDLTYEEIIKYLTGYIKHVQILHIPFSWEAVWP